MIDPRNPALRSRATLLAHAPLERAVTLSRKKNDGRFLSSKELRVDRVSLTRHAVILFFLMVLYLVVGPPTDEHEWGFINLMGPVSLCMAGLWTGFKIVTINPRTVWTPIPWFALTSSLYFGFGPLIFIFGPEDAIASLNEFWPVGPSDLWRSNLLNTVSLLTIVAAFLATDKLLGPARGSDRIAPTDADNDDSARTALFFFLGLGLPLRYLLVLPASFGQLSFVLPGSIFILGFLVKLALFMLAYLGAKRRGLWRAGFWMLFATELFSNFITFSKLEVLLVFIMVTLGRFMAKRNVKEFLISGVVILGIFFLIVPLVTWSRLRIRHETGNVNAASFELRTAVAVEAVEVWLKGELEIEGSTEDGGWGRLCYTNPEIACMQLYDSGIVGDSFAFALYNWIPRFLWHDKPIMTLGEDFTILLSGRAGICTGAGVFGEAYWNGGWLMVVLACGYIGVLYAWLSRTALKVVAHSEWVFLPCAFLGITMGLRIDDWFAPTFVSGILLYLVYYAVIRLATSFAQNRD
jgi:hypothetical protein